MSHYQQLFKSRGNNGDGFGHMQRKERWLQKQNKGSDEPDAASLSKLTKSYLNRAAAPRASPADRAVTKSSERGCDGGADVRGKLKIRWPPETKSAVVSPVQQTYMQKNITDNDKASTYRKSFSDNNQLKINRSLALKDNVKKLSNPFVTGVKEPPQTSRYKSVERSLPEVVSPTSPQAKRGSIKESIATKIQNFSVLAQEGGRAVTIQRPEQKNITPPSKTSKLTPNRVEADQNKTKKSVRFDCYQSVDGSQREPRSLPLRKTAEECSTQCLDHTKQSKARQPQDWRGVSGKNNSDHLSSDSRKQSDSKAHYETPNKGHLERPNVWNQESAATEGSGQDIPQNDITVLNGGVDKIEESLNTLGPSETTHSTKDVMQHQEPSEIPPAISNDFVSSSDSDKHHAQQSSAQQMNKEETGFERDKNLCVKKDPAQDQDNSVSQPKPLTRTNSQGSVKQAEKTRAKLGSWSNRKSPLSKLFTSGGNEKTNKTEPKDTKKPEPKPGGGLLGRLFQSSTERAEETVKLPVQDERDEEVNAHKKKAEETEKAAEVLKLTERDERNEGANVNEGKAEQIEEVVTTEMQKDGNISQVAQPPQERDCGENTEGQLPYTVDFDANEAVSVSAEHGELLSSAGETPAAEQTDPHPADNPETNLQSSQLTGLSVAPASDAQPGSPASELSVSQPAAERDADGLFGAPFSDDLLDEKVGSAPVEYSATQNQTLADESTQNLKESPDALSIQEDDLGNGDLGSINSELLPDSSHPFDVPDSQESVVNVAGDLFTAPVSDTLLSEVDTFNLLSPQPRPTESEATPDLTDHLMATDSAPVALDEDQTSDPFGTSSQTTDFDIFSSNDTLVSQSLPVNDCDGGRNDASANQPPPLIDDFFGLSDISNSTDVIPVPSSTPGVSNSLDDLFGSDASFTMAPAAQTDLFAADMFTSETHLLPLSETSDVNLFVDGFLAPDNRGSEQIAETTSTGGSWMDDLLG